MSRVFEALTKVEKEKKRRSENASNRGDEAVSLQSTGGNGQIAEWHAGRNGHRHDSREPAVSSAGAGKSWRERIEELIFGWDLRRYTSYPIVALEKESPASEQYKILREQIKRLRTESGIKTFAITSPVKRDGKTTVAVNLSVALALDYEEKVLLIDGDLRAPGIHNYFNANALPGLTDYLGSSYDGGVHALVQETFLPGLKVLPAGKPSNFSSELLAKEKMQQLMDEIRVEFSGYQIVVDTPPVLSTPDPLVLARQVDGVLMVVRAGRTPRDYLLKALQSLNSNKLMGVVLNGAELGMASKYYYYSASPTQ